MPVHVENTFEVKGKPPEAVFDFICDFRNQMKWNDQNKNVTMHGDAPVGLGTKFDSTHFRMGQLLCEVVEYQRPRSLRFRFTAAKGEMNFRAEFSPTAGGTQVKTTTDLQLSGFMRLMSPMIQSGMSKDLPEHQLKLARYLEQN